MENYAWPLVALILASASLVIFRAPLTRFIDRWKSLKIGGTGIDAVPTSQMSQGTPALESGEVEPAKPIELDTVFGMALLGEYESAINMAMQQRYVAEEKERDDLVKQLEPGGGAERTEHALVLVRHMNRQRAAVGLGSAAIPTALRVGYRNQADADRDDASVETAHV